MKHASDDVMRMVPYLCGLPPKNPWLQSNHDENIRRLMPPIKGRSIIIRPVCLKTVKVIKHEESLRNCHSQEEPKEM